MFHVQVTTAPCVFFVTALSARHHGHAMLREMTQLVVAAEEEMVEDALVVCRGKSTEKNAQ